MARATLTTGAYFISVLAAEEISHYAVFNEFGCKNIEMFFLSVRAECSLSEPLYASMMGVHGVIEVLSSFSVVLGFFLFIYVLKSSRRQERSL